MWWLGAQNIQIQVNHPKPCGRMRYEMGEMMRPILKSIIISQSAKEQYDMVYSMVMAALWMCTGDGNFMDLEVKLSQDIPL